MSQPQIIQGHVSHNQGDSRARQVFQTLGNVARGLRHRIVDVARDIQPQLQVGFRRTPRTQVVQALPEQQFQDFVPFEPQQDVTFRPQLAVQQSPVFQSRVQAFETPTFSQFSNAAPVINGVQTLQSNPQAVFQKQQGPLLHQDPGQLIQQPQAELPIDVTPQRAFQPAQEDPLFTPIPRFSAQPRLRVQQALIQQAPSFSDAQRIQRHLKRAVFEQNSEPVRRNAIRQIGHEADLAGWSDAQRDELIREVSEVRSVTFYNPETDRVDYNDLSLHPLTAAKVIEEIQRETIANDGPPTSRRAQAIQKTIEEQAGVYGEEEALGPSPLAIDEEHLPPHRRTMAVLGRSTALGEQVMTQTALVRDSYALTSRIQQMKNTRQFQQTVQNPGIITASELRQLGVQALPPGSPIQHHETFVFGNGVSGSVFEAPDAMIVTIDGTNDNRDRITDALTAIDVFSSGRVRAAGQIVSRATTLNTVKPVYVVGHSLGGQEAELGARQAISDDQSLLNRGITVVTIDALRNDTLANNFGLENTPVERIDIATDKGPVHRLNAEIHLENLLKGKGPIVPIPVLILNAPGSDFFESDRSSSLEKAFPPGSFFQKGLSHNHSTEHYMRHLPEGVTVDDLRQIQRGALPPMNPNQAGSITYQNRQLFGGVVAPLASALKLPIDQAKQLFGGLQQRR